MLHIDTSTNITLEDFIAHKGEFPFCKWRKTAKGINFSLLFGCSANRFAVYLETHDYTEEEAMEYIKDTNNMQLLQSTILKNQGKLDKKHCVYLTAATLMRDSFFDIYKGLASRIEREQAYAKKHGFVRSWHGPVRHLPELSYVQYGRGGSPAGADRALYSSAIAHLLNDACNSTIQTMEARVAFSTWHESCKYLKEWNLKTKIWNNIHDSLDLWIWKPELQLVAALLNACASWPREPVYGIPMSMDLECADVQDIDHRHNTYWKHGVEVEVLPIEEAVDNWNAKNKDVPGFTPIKWHGCYL